VNVNGTNHTVEIIKLQKHEQFFYCWFAVDGEPTEDFTVHASVRDTYRSESEFMNYLQRTAIDLYEQFGSVRDRLHASDPTAAFLARQQRQAA
jgi:hypothetical protein